MTNGKKVNCENVTSKAPNRGLPPKILRIETGERNTESIIKLKYQ